MNVDMGKVGSDFLPGLCDGESRFRFFCQDFVDVTSAPMVVGRVVWIFASVTGI